MENKKERWYHYVYCVCIFTLLVIDWEHLLTTWGF
jgi:hypothetical protein